MKPLAQSDLSKLVKKKRVRHSRRRGMAEKIVLVRRICERYRTGNYKIESCCETEGVPAETFYDWLKNEIIAGVYNAAFKESDQRRKKAQLEAANQGILKAATGYEYDETMREAVHGADGKLTITNVKTTRKVMPPNVTACIWIQKNLDPTGFPDRARTEISGTSGAALQVAPQVVNFIIPDNNRSQPTTDGAAPEPGHPAS